VLTLRGWCFMALAVLLGGSAWAQDDEDGGLRRPSRLTVGVGERFLGQLAPDGNTLIFVSNRNIATEIFVQDLEQGRERRLFDEGADVTWPRISPDGKHLLYISFRNQASGQLCVRDLPGAEGRRCLDEESSALQAEWLDASHIALVSRATIQGDLRLSRVTVKRELSVSPLLNRNLTSPTISPDGRWLVYVPVERSVQQVGPGFAARASPYLEALRLDRPGAAPIRLALELPGQTGQPVFALDGRSLYVVQFFTDSNADGVVDAGDSGVLFRVPFSAEREDAPELAAASSPDQLTSVAWNCEYPAPAATSLIATCARDRSLDVYQLPLDGQVPSTWDVPRLSEELKMVGRRADQLLLYRQRLLRETRPKIRRLLMMRLSQLHLAFEDFDAAEFYARHMRSVSDPATAGLAEPLLLLINHRRAMKERERGRMVDEPLDAERQHMGALDPAAAPSPPSAVFQHVVRSELAEAAGDFTLARQELEAAQVTDTTPRAVLEAWFEQADSLYRKLDDREAVKELRAAWPELKNQREVHALYGAIQHEDFLRGHDPAAAERANRHYLIALDLVRNNVRYRAMILGALGMLHTQVGNFHIALGYLEQRDKLPYVDNWAGLAVSLARARALLHVGREEEAARAADQALAMVDATPKLARFVTLALDRAALYNLAAGRFERALTLYDRELPTVETGPSDAAGLRNRLVVRLARCAAELGAGQPQRALEDLDRVDRDLANPAVQATLKWAHTTPQHVQRSYRIIAAGPRANAETRLGHLEAAAHALEQRRALFLEQFAESDRDEDIRAVTLAEMRLAENSVDRQDTAQAARWLGKALEHADTLLNRTHAPVDASQLAVLWFAAQLHSAGNTQVPFDVPKRLDQAQRSLIEQRDPSWRAYQGWFEIYLALSANPPAEVRNALLLPAQPESR